MASIAVKDGKHTVRYRDLDGTEHRRACPDKATATRLKAEIERAQALGQDWRPARAAPSTDAIILAYIPQRAGHGCEGKTFEVLVYQCEVFRRWAEVYAPSSADWSRRMLTQYHTHLRSTGRHGRGRAANTSIRYVALIERIWAWAWSWRGEFDWDGIPEPGRITTEMEREPEAWRDHATWDEMARAIRAASGWNQTLCAFIGMTGLRVQQALDLRVGDIDATRGEIRIRPELGKTQAERAGRVIPVSPHVLALVKQLDPPPDGFLLPCDRKTRLPRPRDTSAAWTRADVRGHVWEGRPYHAFRAGFISSLGTSAERLAVEYLVGHQTSIPTARAYIDPRTLRLAEAVAHVPNLAATLAAPPVGSGHAADTSPPNTVGSGGNPSTPDNARTRTITRKRPSDNKE